MESLPRAGDSSLTVSFDAVVLAGGRASRLGGHPKPQLAFRGATLLDRALEAVAPAHAAVVVGPGPGESGGPGAPGPRREGPLLYAREVPRYGGPLAALGAGLAALSSVPGPRPDWVAVLAADLPRAPEAVRALLDAAARTGAARSAGMSPLPEGVVGEDESGRRQPLLAVYRRNPLEEGLRRLTADGGLADRPMKHLVVSLDLLALRLPPGAADDVDTWDAVRRWGIDMPRQEEAP